MADRQTAAGREPGTNATTGSIAAEANRSDLPEWMDRAMRQGVKPEQALACIGLGLMNQLRAGGTDLPWLWNEEESQDEGGVDLPGLHQRLETIQLALQTGAPLSTAEVSELLGARPGAAEVRRGGIVATRVSRNVWKLSRVSDADAEDRQSNALREGFRRRL